MTDLIAVLSTGKGTWGHVKRVIEEGEWEKIYLITNEFGRENFTAEKDARFIVLESRKPMMELIEEIKEAIKDVTDDFALNFISGSGKEHMALMAALISSGKTFRLIAITKEGMKKLW